MSSASDDTEAMGYEQWREALSAVCGRYNPCSVTPNDFAGFVKPLSLCGCAAVAIGWNEQRVERTSRDVRLDGMDHYYVVLQVAGACHVAQNGRASRLDVGDVALIDSVRPVVYHSNDRGSRWVGLHLSRSLVSQLAVVPEGGACARGDTLAGRLFHRLILGAARESSLSPARAEPYVQLALYDLLGAMFGSSTLPPLSSNTDKLFERLCCIIKSRFADPRLRLANVAAEAGISLRYLQKLFTARGSSCTSFMNSVRLDHAARLLHHRAVLRSGQPLSEIALASGFADYNYFARAFRRRFGHPPGNHAI